MLSVTINKDVDQYQEAVVAGLTAKQFVSVTLAVLSGGGFVAFLYFVFHIDYTIGIYAGIPICIPFVLLGFDKGNGMSSIDKLKWNRRKKGPICFGSTENKVVYEKNNQVVLEQLNNSDSTEINKVMKKMKRLVIAAIVIFLLIITGTILLKALC